jgi:outer membrane protein insertion porin family
LFFAVLVLLTGGAVCARAQATNPQSLSEKRCLESVAPGRPTLKRRQTNSDTSPEAPRCDPQDAVTRPVKNPNIVSIKVEGLNALSEAEVVKDLRERGLGSSQEQMPDSRVLAQAVARLKELLERRGYFHALVEAREDAAERTLTLSVYEGLRSSLAEVRFEGNKIFPSHELTTRMGKCVSDTTKAKDDYNAEILDFCLRGLANFLRSRGYLQATLGEPTTELTERGVVLTLPVQEGLIYRLGEIEIVGAQSLAPTHIREVLSLKQGDIASSESIGKWLFEDLKKKYGEMGYIEFTAEAEPDFKSAAKGSSHSIVDFKITIEEGRQFILHAIKFQGGSFAESELLGFMKIRAGEVYNHRLFEESINELNKLGRFEFIDKDRDTDFRTDEEEALVDIIIKLNQGTASQSRASRL